MIIDFVYSVCVNQHAKSCRLATMHQQIYGSDPIWGNVTLSHIVWAVIFLGGYVRFSHNKPLNAFFIIYVYCFDIEIIQTNSADDKDWKSRSCSSQISQCQRMPISIIVVCLPPQVKNKTGLLSEYTRQMEKDHYQIVGV